MFPWLILISFAFGANDAFVTPTCMARVEHRVAMPTLFATPEEQRDRSRRVIKDAEQAVSAASQIFKEAQDALDTSYEELHNKQMAVAAAEAVVTDLQNTIKNNPTDGAKSDVRDAKEDVDRAKIDVRDAKSDIDRAMKAIRDAKEDIEKAENKLTAANRKLVHLVTVTYEDEDGNKEPPTVVPMTAALFRETRVIYQECQDESNNNQKIYSFDGISDGGKYLFTNKKISA